MSNPDAIDMLIAENDRLKEVINNAYCYLDMKVHNEDELHNNASKAKALLEAELKVK